MHGIWTALVTPFSSNNQIDRDAFKNILADQKSAGVAGVIPCGTTGESPTLSLDEKKELIQIALAETRGTAVKVIAGTGSNNTAETVELSRWASEQGVAGVLVVTPYYNKPSQAGLEAHFLAVADSVQCEVMLYNVPGRTGINLNADTTARLSKHPRIRSIKEASANLAFLTEIREQLTKHKTQIDILSGDDATFLASLSYGATGVVSVASNLFPRGMIQIQEAFQKGDTQGALQLHQKYYPLFRDLFVDSNPVPLKSAMEIFGFCHSRLRLPLVQLSDSHRRILEESIKLCGLTPGRQA